MQLGFVLDQEACIGCHACTVGCKAENDVPLGSFRTWVKWIESGDFPETKRSAAVLRCNHCANAPCIEICPTGALSKLENGIVDLDEKRCIGCASCLQACPYDAIYIDDRVGTAAKCHFCAHRIEVGLAPACVSVCPEQAIKVVDMANPETLLELEARDATKRKEERGTVPHTTYLGVDANVLDPLAVDGARTLSHAEVPDPMPAPGSAEARTVYDVPRPRRWGNKIAAYMVTKAIASGALLASASSPWIDALSTNDAQVLGGIGVLFTLITAALLVLDLHKPSRFFYVLTKPNPGSWLVKGGWVITVHGVLCFLFMIGVGEMVGSRAVEASLAALAVPVAFLMSMYTAFLFRQARGRELWCEDVLLPVALAVQTVVSALVLGAFFGTGGLLWLLLYPGVVLAQALWPQRTEQARRAHKLMLRHPAFAAGAALTLVGLVVPVALFAAFFLLDWVYIKAGQEVPLS